MNRKKKGSTPSVKLIPYMASHSTLFPNRDDKQKAYRSAGKIWENQKKYVILHQSQQFPLAHQSHKTEDCSFNRLA